ncbi:MAG: MFS transporter, partial [Microcoleaceae cyanobacterium]
MSIFSQQKLPEWLPRLSPQIWILAFGRFLSQTGTGFTIFYTTIFFVNQVGLSATQVGLGLGSAQISGIIGRLLSGVICDSPKWGRKRTLLLSCILSSIASFLLASSHNFSTMVTGNLLMGFAIGLYWPATET